MTIDAVTIAIDGLGGGNIICCMAIDGVGMIANNKGAPHRGDYAPFTNKTLSQNGDGSRMIRTGNAFLAAECGLRNTLTPVQL